jgi:hypothetical protein
MAARTDDLRQDLDDAQFWLHAQAEAARKRLKLLQLPDIVAISLDNARAQVEVESNCSASA